MSEINNNAKLRLGNYGVARGAYEAGCTVASAYPGTPSTEITELISKYPEINAEWSPNEKVALEVGVGASIGGARAIVCMKHVGLNVAADPLFTASYTGVSGGLVVVVADDPGMFSSQNEQDSRFYARAAHVPMLEPSDTQEAKDFTGLAFELSEKYDTPVLLRMCTRVAHSQSALTENVRQDYALKPYAKNIAKYVMMPGIAKKRHVVVEQRMDRIAADVNSMDINREELAGAELGIVCAGAVYQYVKEALPEASVFKAGTVFPLPVDAIRAFSKKVKKLVVAEELEPFIEMQLKAHGIMCEGKKYFSKQSELSVNIIREKLLNIKPAPAEDMTLPQRPPVLCAGCPHRGVFHIMAKLKLTVMGDIGCYTLGALSPLSSVDTVLCMGASLGMAIGFEKARGAEASKSTVAVIGDSTFIHSGITGLIDAVYNGLNTKLVIMDNSTTGMTGHQQHPATGKTLKETDTYKLSLEEVVRACGVKNLSVVNAFDIGAVEQALKAGLAAPGVSVIITRGPCALIVKEHEKPLYVNGKCTRCGLCLKIGCPALNKAESGHAVITSEQCTGCAVCQKLCRFGAIVRE